MGLAAAEAQWGKQNTRNNVAEPVIDAALAELLTPLPKELQPQHWLKREYGIDIKDAYGPLHKIRSRYGFTSSGEDAADAILPHAMEEHQKQVDAYRKPIFENYANKKLIEQLVPQQTLGELLEAVGPETFAAAGGRVPMTEPMSSLTGGVTPPERPLPTRGPMIAPIPPMGASAFAPRFDVPGGTEPAAPAFQLPNTIQPPAQLTPVEPTMLRPREMLEAPIPPLVKRGIIEAVGARAKALPVKPTTEELTKSDLRKFYLSTGNLEGLERLGDVREKAKEEKDEANKLGDILMAAGVPKGGPQWQKAFSALADKLSTHPPGTKVTTNIDTKQETEESKTVGKGFGEAYVSFQRAGADANAKISKLDRMTSLLQGVTTGKLIPTLTDVEALGATFGFKVNPDLPAKQALESLSNEIALELRNTGSGNGMPGQLSDKDREFLVAMTPNLSKTPEGNALIIETRKKLLQREREVARLAREYRKKNGHIDEGFYDELQAYVDKHPLFSTGKPWEKYKK